MKKLCSASDFEAAFASFCDIHQLLLTDSLLVAFSGGADSAVLLTLLHKACQSRHIRLSALHVNHMIRGQEADRDAAFCGTFFFKNMSSSLIQTLLSVPDSHRIGRLHGSRTYS